MCLYEISAMIQRFTEVSAPIEERMEAGIVASIWYTIQTVVSLSSSMNSTLHDDELIDRATHAVFEASKPGSVSFSILVTAIVVWVVRMLFVRKETLRILNSHAHFGNE